MDAQVQNADRIKNEQELSDLADQVKSKLMARLASTELKEK